MGMSASDILTRAAGHIADRAASRDQDGGERSMGRAVTAFNALYGYGLTETQGWAFMAVLKLARSAEGDYHADDYEDGAAYMALAGESADREDFMLHDPSDDSDLIHEMIAEADQLREAEQNGCGTKVDPQDEEEYANGLIYAAR